MLSNNEQHVFVNPRISFSNDFVDTQSQQTTRRQYQTEYKEADPVVSSDFEFKIQSYAMIPADEIIFEGVLLPLENETRRVTLREELSVRDDHDDKHVHMVSKGFSWWTLGLKSKKDHKKKVFARHVHDQVDDVLVANKTQNSLARILECEE